MNRIDLTITPRDPVVARDGRPFGAKAGNRMKSLDWPYPSMVAGTVRTMAGLLEGGFDPKALRAIAVHGPLPAVGGQLYFPAPKDILFQKPDRWFRLRPAEYGAGESSDLATGLRPVLLPDAVEDDFKPDTGPAFWPLAAMEQWLLEPQDLKKLSVPAGPITEKDSRTHVKILADRGAAEDEMLFQTTGLAFREGVSLAVRLEGAGQLFDRLEGLPALYPLGGERRLAEWRKGIVEGWTCPDEIANKTAKGKYLRLILATPAIFQHGWRPGWIGEDGKGTIPGTEIGVTLVAAAVDRWRAISGWSYEDRHSGKRQKPVRRLVPAGSVYFFEREGIDLAFPATERWLRPVCDAEQDGLDGFGLGLWGIWREHGEVSK